MDLYETIPQDTTPQEEGLDWICVFLHEHFRNCEQKEIATIMNVKLRLITEMALPP